MRRPGLPLVLLGVLLAVAWFIGLGNAGDHGGLDGTLAVALSASLLLVRRGGGPGDSGEDGGDGE